MSLAAKGRAAGKAARVSAGFLGEKLARRRPTQAEAIPLGPRAFTVEWLTAALCKGVAGAEVASFELGPRNDGTTARRPLSVSYNDAGREAGLPGDLFTKSTSTYLSRIMLSMLDALSNEGEFYANIGPTLDLEVPLAHHIAYDERWGRSMFILDDVSKTRGAEFGSPLRYVDRAAAESMIRQMATYHAAFWGRPELEGLTHLTTSRDWQDSADETIAFGARTLVGLERTRAFCPPELLRRRDELYPAATRATELSVRGPLTFCHFDTHQGNWYQAGDGRMGQFDWQATVKGRWACDVAYALSSALTIDDRRAWERELIEMYIEEASSRGVKDPPRFEGAWLEYRQQMFHGLIFWLFTIGQGRFYPDMQPRDVCEANCERMEQAVIDLDSFAAVAA